ncbi:hypothetical protein HYN56_04190 [Flavobacterium crocinum]|uniref:Uncharacterized protein n=1 Tax=Flavobacterium crocinum TaxID=2183896 RepID=A0A2S1YHC0_9FLAO|nr:hypothetical protein HYN56_04190 [Flavobacterium crocinum]
MDFSNPNTFKVKKNRNNTKGICHKGVSAQSFILITELNFQKDNVLKSQEGSKKLCDFATSRD